MADKEHIDIKKSPWLSDFPIFKNVKVNGRPLTYLDTSASAQKPQSVIDRIAYNYSHEYANVHRGLYPLSEHETAFMEEARDKLKNKNAPKSLDEVDPKLLAIYDKLGVPLKEREALAGVVAVDAVMDSVSVTTTYKAKLEAQGIIFCSFSEAVKNHPDLVKKYLGSVVPYTDNFFAALNSAVFSDGSFVFIPKGVRCPIELSTYFRINAAKTGQFERTLIVADEGAYVSYLEGCTAPQRDENQLHAAVVEIVVLKDAEVKYSNASITKIKKAV